MELTKEQILFIDHRLENDGIKFWDIRIEMLDHVVSDIENRLILTASEYDFKALVQDSFENLGWKENFNGGGFEEVYLKRCKNYTHQSNKGIINGYKKAFMNAKSVSVIVLFYLCLFIFQDNIIVMKYFFIAAVGLAVIALVGYFIKYKVFNSIRLNRLFFLTFFPLSLLNAFVFFPKVFFGYENLSSSYLTAVFGMIFPPFVIGLNHLFNEFKTVQELYNKLID